MSHQSRTQQPNAEEQSGANQTGLDWTGPERTRVDQSRAHLCRQRGAQCQGHLAPGLPHNHAFLLHDYTVILSSYSTAVMFSQPNCITTVLLALNNIFLFTVPQTGDSCWHLISVTNHQLIKHVKQPCTQIIKRTKIDMIK